jgi:iron-sulfur cluster insertion protein
MGSLVTLSIDSSHLWPTIHNMTITELAATKVKGMAQEQELGDHGLRIAVVGGGCSGFTYDMDFENGGRPGDHEEEFFGLKVFIDPMSSCYLEGTKIDYVESFQFTGFHFENPNASSTCGCGSSFSV